MLNRKWPFSHNAPDADKRFRFPMRVRAREHVVRPVGKYIRFRMLLWAVGLTQVIVTTILTPKQL